MATRTMTTKYFTAKDVNEYHAKVENDPEENTGLNGEADIDDDLENYTKRVDVIAKELDEVKKTLKDLKKHEKTGTEEQAYIQKCIEYTNNVKTQLKSKTKSLKEIIKEINKNIEKQRNDWIKQQAMAANNNKVNIDV